MIRSSCIACSRLTVQQKYLVPVYYQGKVQTMTVGERTRGLILKEVRRAEIRRRAEWAHPRKGASWQTLYRRSCYTGKKGRSALRKLRNLYDLYE